MINEKLNNTDKNIEYIIRHQKNQYSSQKNKNMLQL